MIRFNGSTNLRSMKRDANVTCAPAKGVNSTARSICSDRRGAWLQTLLVPATCLVGMVLAGDSVMAANTVGTVFYIDMENHNLVQPNPASSPNQLQGNAAAPFLNSLMTPGNPNAAQTSWASNYTNVAVGVHPSEPNYVWQESGMHGPLNDNDPYPSNIANAPNLSSLLQQKYGTSGWKSYQEDTNTTGGTTPTNTPLTPGNTTVPTTSFSGTSAGYTNVYNGSHQFNFAAKHDGQLFFTATNGGTSTAADTSTANPEAKYYAPLQQLSTDLANNTVAKYNLITPDQYNDMHSALNTNFTYHGVTYQAGTDQEAVALGDSFLSIIVPQIMASQAYQNNGAIVIWFDETEGGDTSGFTVPEIVISPLAKGNAYNSTLPYTHSSDLKTLEELYGVYGPGGAFLGDANTPGTNDLSDLFVTGAIPAAVPEPSSILLMGFGVALVAALGHRFRRNNA